MKLWLGYEKYLKKFNKLKNKKKKNLLKWNENKRIFFGLLPYIVRMKIMCG